MAREAHTLDPRSQRSRAALRDALAEALGTTPFEEITVVLLTQRAGVNRSTFYQHYLTPENLLIDLVNTRLQDTGIADAEGTDPADAHVPACIARLVAFAGEWRETYRHRLSNPARNSFLVCVHGQVRSLSGRLLGEGERAGKPLSLAAPGLSGAITGIVSDWMVCDEPLPAEDLADSLWRLIGIVVFAVECGDGVLRRLLERG